MTIPSQQHQEPTASINTIHLWYAIGILIGINILIVVLAYFEIPNLVDRLNLGLTMTSLVLALVAIFYTIFSSSKQDAQLMRLLDVESEIRSASRVIADYSKGLEVALKPIHEKFDKVHEKLGVIAQEKMQKITPGAMGGDEKADGDEIEWDVKRFNRIFAGLTFANMGLLYAYRYIWLKGFQVDMTKWVKLTHIDKEYTTASLNVFESVGLIKYKTVNSVIVPVLCNDILDKNIEKYVNDAISVLGPDHGGTKYLSLIVDGCKHFEDNKGG